MHDLIEILAIVLPVFLVIGTGFVLARIRFVDGPTNAAFSRLVFYLCAPSLLFRSAARTPVHEVLRPDVLFVAGGVSLLLAALVYAGAARSQASRRGVLAQGAFRSNMVFFGLPIVLYAFGEGTLGRAAGLIGFMVVVYNLLAVLVLVLPHRARTASGDGRTWSSTGLEIARNPLILGTAAGIACSALGIELPRALDRALELVGRIAAPLALLTVGAGLDLRRLRADVGPAALASALKLIVYPALIWGVLRLLGTGELEREVAVLILASPTAVVSVIMAREMNGDESLASALVIGTTLAALVTTSAWLAFFRWAS
jgi:predicted permease